MNRGNNKAAAALASLRHISRAAISGLQLHVDYFRMSDLCTAFLEFIAIQTLRRAVAFRLCECSMT
jgi:hypothetical protein